MSEKLEDCTEYVKQTAKLMGLTISPEYLPGVVGNFQSLVEISSLITEFKLTEETEIAPTFEPRLEKN
jgi:hypothetical protein